MKHNIRSEIKTSMDAIHFSREAKEAMVDTLVAQMEELNMKNQKSSSKKLLLITLAATLLLATLTGAAAFTRWSRSAQANYQPSQEIKEQAEKSGLSVMLENTDSNEILSVTDQGITVTAVQTIVDNYGAELTFRIDGFELPEGCYPDTWPEVTIDGTQEFYTYQGGDFYDGTTQNENGEWVYASNGQSMASDENGTAILDYVAADGSLEYTHVIAFDDDSGKYLGKEIVVNFDGFGVQSLEKAGFPETLTDGNWELRWTLTGTEEKITVTPNTEIGSSGVTLLEAEIGQVSLRTVYQLEHYWEGWETLEMLPQGVCGVRMKDGTEHLCYSSTEGYQDQDALVFFVESNMFDTILDLSQVESLMFHKGWELDANGEPTIQTFYYIPVA